MPEGWEYVLATYVLTALVLGLWFAMIGAKLRRLRRAGAHGAGAAEAGASRPRPGASGAEPAVEHAHG